MQKYTTAEFLSSSEDYQSSFRKLKSDSIYVNHLIGNNHPFDNNFEIFQVDKNFRKITPDSL